MSWRQWNSVLHRDIGFLCIGLTLVYAISGVAVNHIGDWNPSYTVINQTFEVGDLDPLWDLIADPEIRVVLHAGGQDVQIAYDHAKRPAANVFDTQIAAGLLGMAPQLGYATLARDLFDVELPKSHTRADWTRRPLPEGLLHYAAEDVEYLLPAYEFLGECLERKGRLEWAEEDSAALLDPALYAIDPSQAISRLKGARNLKGRARTAAPGCRPAWSAGPSSSTPDTRMPS